MDLIPNISGLALTQLKCLFFSYDYQRAASSLGGRGAYPSSSAATRYPSFSRIRKFPLKPRVTYSTVRVFLVPGQGSVKICMSDVKICSSYITSNIR